MPAGLLALVGVLGFAPASLATHGPNVFAGNWSTTAGGQAPGSLTLKVVTAATGVSQLQGFGGQPCPQPTTYYYGNYSNLGESGVISGCTPTANHLVGRFRSNTKPQPGHSAFGDGDITFTPPKSFAGTLTYEGSSYSYTGTFSSHTPDDGSGGAPPPPGPPTTVPPPPGGPPTPPGGPTPPSSTPTGTSPGSSTSTGPSSTSTPIAGSPLSKIQSSLVGLPGPGSIVVAEPAPGASVTIASPNPLTGSPTTAFRVTDSLGDFPGSTIVAPGELRTPPSGELVACWLIGPDALQIPPGAYGRPTDLKFFDGRLNASQAYTSCAGVARSLAAAVAAHPAAVTAPAPAPAGGCAVRRFEIAIHARKGLITDARPLNATAPGASGLRYACQRAADGSLTITVAAPPKGGLRAALGEQLRLGVIRAPAAPARHATMTFSFGASWAGNWRSTRGAMHLTQKGVHLTGTYAACRGRATVTGLISGSSFDGTWRERCSSRGGRLHFTLAADGRTLRGSASNGHAPPSIIWNATRGQ